MDGWRVVCPHAAFQNDSAPEDARARESVKCLVLVIYPEGSSVTEEESQEV